MKRILAWILIMVLFVGCAGCKENETEKEQTGSENLETATDGENKPVSVDNTDETENDDFRLTIYTDLYSEEYQELGNAQMWLSGFSEETEGKKIRFCSDVDDVYVTLEQGEWMEAPLYFRPVDCMFNVETKAGKVYEFDGYLAECIPLYRITAFKGDKTAVWYLMEDGKDGKQVFEVAGEEPHATCPEITDPILSLCAVYAGLSIRVEEDIAYKPEQFWTAIANAVTIVTLQTADADAEGNIYLDYETLNKYAEAMFPETGVYPDIKESDGIIWPESAEDSVIVKANFTVDDSTVVVRSMEVTDDRNVDITLLFKGEIEEYAVVHISPVSEVQNPFKWVITGVELAKG